jgi:hypothetical protein
MLRPTVSRPVCLGINYCLTVAVCWSWAPSLTRGRVCRLQLLLALASAVISWSEFRRTRGHILLSQIRDFPFRRLLRLAGSRWRYLTPPPHGLEVNFHSCILSYPLGTGHTQKTQPLYCCMAQTTLKTSHMIAISPVHWRADCCLATSYKHSSYCCVLVSWGVYSAVAWQCVDISQYDDLKLNAFIIRPYTTCSGPLGHYQVRWNSGELLCLPRYCDPYLYSYNVFKWSQYISSSCTICTVSSVCGCVCVRARATSQYTLHIQAANQKNTVTGSSPDEVIGFVQFT